MRTSPTLNVLLMKKVTEMTRRNPNISPTETLPLIQKMIRNLRRMMNHNFPTKMINGLPSTPRARNNTTEIF